MEGRMNLQQFHLVQVHAFGPVVFFVVHRFEPVFFEKRKTVLRGAKGDFNSGENKFGLLNPVFQKGFTEALLVKVLVYHAPAHNHVRLFGILGRLVDANTTAAHDLLIVKHHPVRALRLNVLVEKGIKQRQFLLCKIQRHIAPENFQKHAFVFGKVWLNG